jgi:transposase
MQCVTVGLDLAKNVFQVHGVDERGEVLLRQRLRRAQIRTFFSQLKPCLIGMEACGTAHFWARELMNLGHQVRIIPPAYVKAYVRRNKNDAADAAAICEAVTRPNMRFVPVKTEEQQATLMLHKSRDLLVRQQTMLVNALRGHMSELGLIAAQGCGKTRELIAVIEDVEDESIPGLARAALLPLVAQLRAAEETIATLTSELVIWHKSSAASQRLATVPGIGILTATAIAATVPDASAFRSGREFAAWIGLTPRQHSSGGKDRLGRISKQGNRPNKATVIFADCW